MAALVDTNVLVYRFDSRFPDKQNAATELLRRGILEYSVRLPHQAIVGFVAAVTRPIRGHTILKHADALREADLAQARGKENQIKVKRYQPPPAA